MRPRPLARDESPVPAQQRLWTNEERTPALARQDPACCREQCAVPHPVDGALHLTAKDRYLMTEDKDLDLGRLIWPIARRQYAKQPAKNYIEE